MGRLVKKTIITSNKPMDKKAMEVLNDFLDSENDVLVCNITMPVGLQLKIQQIEVRKPFKLFGWLF